MRKWRNYQRELRSLIWNLETERVRFQDICEKLLVGLVSPCQIESMVEDPFGPAWHEDTIQAKIKTRLWRSFSVFENTIKEIEKATKEMMTQLNVQSGGNIKWQEETNFVVRELRRASFVLKRSDYAEQISTIKDGITSLESVID
ncbi:C-14 sterol reductase [Colletotrichum asianum]